MSKNEFIKNGFRPLLFLVMGFSITSCGDEQTVAKKSKTSTSAASQNATLILKNQCVECHQKFLTQEGIDGSREQMVSRIKSGNMPMGKPKYDGKGDLKILLDWLEKK